MDNYKNEFYQFADDRIKGFDNEINDDISPGIQDVEHNYDLSDVENELVDQMMNLISNVCNNPIDLSNILQQVISLHKIRLNEIIVNSSLFPQIMETFKKNPIPPLIQSVCDLVYFSPKLTYILFKFDLINILYSSIFSTDLDISHKSFEFIQKIIPYGVVNRVVLYCSGFFDVIFQYLQRKEYSSLFPFAIHTFFVFIMYDPVYGINSYSRIGGKLPKRSIVMDQCRQLNIPDKVMFNISSFLKHGNGQCSKNGSIYKIIDFLLMSNDEIMTLIGFRIANFLSLRCKENANKILNSTQFINSAYRYLCCNVAKIQILIFNIIKNIILYKCNYCEKRIINLNPFLIGLQIICADNAPTELKVAAGRCIFCAVINIDYIQNQFHGKQIFESLLNAYDNSDIRVRSEICCIIISILINCLNDDDSSFLSPNLVISFTDYLADYDDNLILTILHLFFALLIHYNEIMLNILCNEETIDVFYQLISHKNDDIADVANAIIEILHKSLINEE